MRAFSAAILGLLACLSVIADESYTARVVRVIDGDTLVIEGSGHVSKLRLFGIDCPEKGQAGAEHAAWFTASMVAGQTVQITARETDRYGRTVADIVLRDGRDLNKELVKYGQAWWYSKYDPDDAEMQGLEAGARERRLGVWADANPLPPWEWRKAMRNARSARSRSTPRRYETE